MSSEIPVEYQWSTSGVPVEYQCGTYMGGNVGFAVLVNQFTDLHICPCVHTTLVQECARNYCQVVGR